MNQLGKEHFGQLINGPKSSLVSRDDHVAADGKRCCMSVNNADDDGDDDCGRVGLTLGKVRIPNGFRARCLSRI